MKITNIKSFLTLIEGLNNDIDELLTENIWTGDTLSGTASGSSVLDTSQETPDEKEKVQKGLDENFFQEGDVRDDETLYMTDEELKDLVGEDGAEAIKELSDTDIKNLLLLQATPKLKGYILRSGTKAGRIVLRAAIKGGKIAKGLILAGQLNTSLLSKNSKTVGYCFCMGIVKEFENHPNPSSGSWNNIKDNLDEAYAMGEYEDYQYKKLKMSLRNCEVEFGSSIKKKSKRNIEGSQCDTFSEMLGDFEDAMSAIVAGLSKYFSIREKEGSKSVKKKETGAILSSKEEIEVKFTVDIQLQNMSGSDCANCLSSFGGMLGPHGVKIVKITPTGTSGEKTIKCTWNKQHSNVSYILMEFDSVVVGRTQDMWVTFFGAPNSKLSPRTAVVGQITSME
tara:strand:+ start:4091 stop:5275 length:1185 start_codon:yes stop_codon:yes gene_type:complete